jgi:hypothetical protein
MPSDQLLAELSQDPRTIAYRAQRLAAWSDIRRRHDDFQASAEKNGSSEPAAEFAADLHVRGDINYFVGELLVHSRTQHALEFLTKAPKGWGSRSEMLLDLDSYVTQMVGYSYHIVALNVAVTPLSALTAEDPVKWRAWLEKLMDQLGAAKATAHVFDPKDGKPSPNLGTPSKPPPGPTPSPSPTPPPAPPAPSASETGFWRTALVVVGGFTAGALVVGTVAALRR